jgi:hypothetical protein
MDALDVGEDFDAVAGALGDLRRGDADVQPQ